MKNKTVLWERIDFVLLDLDGTLLDKYFDDYFWEEFLPQKYAERKELAIEAAKEVVYAAYKRQEGKLAWTDIDQWSRLFGIDIPALKESVSDRVALHAGVLPFLQFLRESQKKIALLTNAHSKAVKIKLDRIPLRPYLDTILSANEAGFPKEEMGFWEKAEKIVGFDKERSLFVDDNEEVLTCAQSFGIKHLLHKSHASSKITGTDSRRFSSIRHFGEIVPAPL